MNYRKLASMYRVCDACKKRKRLFKFYNNKTRELSRTCLVCQEKLEYTKMVYEVLTDVLSETGIQ